MTSLYGDLHIYYGPSYVGMVGRIGIDYSKTNKQHTSSLIQLQKLLISLIQKACNNQESELYVY